MKICLLSTNDFLISGKDFEKSLDSLPFGERDKEELRKIKNPLAARESLGARIALMKLCGSNDFGDIKKTDVGKPYFSKSDSPFFSLSHTKGIAAAALCDKYEESIGIDVEIISTNRNLSNIAKRFFSSDELYRYQKDATPESFYSIWTEKEARVKLLGQALSSELSKRENSNKTLYFYKYKVNFFDTHAILCVASKKELKEIIFINDEDFEIYELQNRA